MNQHNDSVRNCFFFRQYWSESQTTDFVYQPTPNSNGSHFVLVYTAVPKNQCQGHPIPLSASEHAQNISCDGLPLNDTSGNNDCRWLLTTSTNDTSE